MASYFNLRGKGNIKPCVITRSIILSLDTLVLTKVKEVELWRMEGNGNLMLMAVEDYPGPLRPKGERIKLDLTICEGY